MRSKQTNKTHFEVYSEFPEQQFYFEVLFTVLKTAVQVLKCKWRNVLHMRCPVTSGLQTYICLLVLVRWRNRRGQISCTTGTLSKQKTKHWDTRPKLTHTKFGYRQFKLSIKATVHKLSLGHDPDCRGHRV